jgi:type IV pilus assembly protein PilC
MPTYAFLARGNDGRSVRGFRQGDSEGALALDLAALGLFLVRAEPSVPKRSSRDKVKLTPKDLAAFLLHLAAYLEVGLSLMDALRDYRDPGRPALEAAVSELALRVAGGDALSEAMGAYPTLFLPVHRAMVRAGETTGRLNEAIRAVIRLVEWEAGFKAQVRDATTYPLILLGVLGFIGFVVSTFSLPAILKLLVELNVPLPLVTRAFLALGRGLTSYGWVVPVVIAVLVTSLRWALKRRSFRFAWDSGLLKTPVLGPLLIRLGLARFAHFLASQYRAGIGLVQALRECEGVTGNARLGQDIRLMRIGVEQGERMAVLAARLGHFPPLIIRMLATGEQAGNLEETLDKVSRVFDAEVATGVKVFFQMVDPVIKVVLAGLLIFVASAVLLPLYTLIGGING